MRRRLVLAIAGVAATALALFGIPLALALQRSYRDEELVRLQRDTITATRNIDLSSLARDRIELPPFGGAIGIYSPAGRRIGGRGPVRAAGTVLAALQRRAPQGVARQGELVVAIPLFNGEHVVGAARGERSQASVAANTRRAWIEIGLFGLGALALTVGAGLGLGRRLARPLEDLVRVARRVGDGDFAARAQPSALPEIDAVSAALNASSAQIGDLIARERDFSANASHQLRTPIAALRLELEAALLSEPGASPVLSSALGQVDRLEATIQTLLALARPPRNSNHGTVDLARAASELRERWHGRLAAAGRPLRVDVAGGEVTARISAAVLDEIVDVLMQNACDHGTGAVEVTVRRSGESLALDISDQGPGFADDPELAFERGNGSGQGIGLSLARALAHSEGALLHVTRAGRGPCLSLLMDPAAPEK